MAVGFAKVGIGEDLEERDEREDCDEERDEEDTDGLASENMVSLMLLLLSLLLLLVCRVPSRDRLQYICSFGGGRRCRVVMINMLMQSNQQSVQQKKDATRIKDGSYDYEYESNDCSNAEQAACLANKSPCHPKSNNNHSCRTAADPTGSLFRSPKIQVHDGMKAAQLYKQTGPRSLTHTAPAHTTRQRTRVGEPRKTLAKQPPGPNPRPQAPKPAAPAPQSCRSGLP